MISPRIRMWQCKIKGTKNPGRQSLVIACSNFFKNPKIYFPIQKPGPQTIKPAPPVCLTIECPLGVKNCNAHAQMQLTQTDLSAFSSSIHLCNPECLILLVSLWSMWWCKSNSEPEDYKKLEFSFLQRALSKLAARLDIYRSVFKAVSHDSTFCIKYMLIMNWYLSCSVDVLFHSVIYAPQHYVHTAQEVPIQHFDTTC